MKRLIFIVNPISGRSFLKNRVVSRIIHSIDKVKYDVTIRFTSYAGHATEIASEAVKEGAHIVVAVGGDGTINEVARSLVNTQTALGIVPCGSGNGLARHMHIPIHIRKAVEIINIGIIDTIDSMTVNGIPCFCTAGVGYDAEVSAEYAKDSRRGLGTYVRKALKGWFKYKPMEYVIETDNQVLKRKAIAVTCANANQWGNGFHVAPRASLKDGILDITIIHPIKFLNALAMPRQILGYTFDKNPNVECLRARKVRIIQEKPNFAHIDGEPIYAPRDVEINVHSKTLKVVVNSSQDKI